MSYVDFAQYYDQLTADVDYKKLAQYYCDIFEKFNKKPEIVLDACCGTGSLAIELAASGYEVIAVDASTDMLMCAQDKAFDAEQQILFLCQKLQEMDLYGTVDAVICSLDSINHICNENELQKAFEKISLFLHPSGIFIFDVNTVYKHQNVLAGNCFIKETEDVFCAWQNDLCEDNLTVEIQLDFFKKNGEQYDRYYESFYERAYTETEIENFLTQAGLEIVKMYGDFNFSEPKKDEERIVYITKKV